MQILTVALLKQHKASGATLWDTIKVYLGEGLPELVRVSTVTLISLVGETAMAGAIGAGGLGYIAIYYDITVQVHQLPFWQLLDFDFDFPYSILG